MSQVSMVDLFKAGAHFGHQKRYWNPKMGPYIFGARNGIHIINLEKSVPLMQEALNFASSTVAKGGTVLFVGTKRAASDIIQKEATRCGMPYVNYRWLGGMLTNFKTIKQSLNGENPFRISDFDLTDELKDWLGQFPNEVGKNKLSTKPNEGISLTDFSIVKEFEKLCQLYPMSEIFIWSLDSDLKHYHQGKSH
ncbi:MAG: 30S ribosomal protein S2 [Moraxella osloensis]|nr:30S ribosomal protein S2 [Moraxella osloensis]